MSDIDCVFFGVHTFVDRDKKMFEFCLDSDVTLMLKTDDPSTLPDDPSTLPEGLSAPLNSSGTGKRVTDGGGM